MFLGKITILINKKNSQYYYCSPISYGLGNIPYPQNRGLDRTINLKIGTLTDDLQEGLEYTLFGIFDRIPSAINIQNGMINARFSAIPETTFNELNLIYHQTHNPFAN